MSEVVEKEEVKVSDIIKDFVDYVFDTANIFDREKFLGGRNVTGDAFGKEANLRYQYCSGGYFAEGWAGNIKFRIYGLTSRTVTTWRYHVCPIDGQINEEDDTFCFIGRRKEMLLDELKRHVLEDICPDI